MNIKHNTYLYFISGKLGAGKTTLAKDIAEKKKAIFISEDLWLSQLFPDAVNTFDDYLLYSKRVRSVVSPHAIALLQQGVSVVFDFAGNTPKDRSWVKFIIDHANVPHVLHYIMASDERCRSQFKKRNRNLPKGSKIVSDLEFDAINRYFIPPEQHEGFNIEYHSKINDD
jgi:predicted kinase